MCYLVLIDGQVRGRHTRLAYANRAARAYAASRPGRVVLVVKQTGKRRRPVALAYKVLGSRPVPMGLVVTRLLRLLRRWRANESTPQNFGWFDGDYERQLEQAAASLIRSHGYDPDTFWERVRAVTTDHWATKYLSWLPLGDYLPSTIKPFGE